MESAAVGPVLTEAVIESLTDLWEIQHGRRPADQARWVVVPDALVDTNTMLLSLPSRMIRQLGLAQTASRHTTRSGASDFMYEAVRLTILGRECTMDVLEVPDDVPVLIGQVALGNLDLVVDQRNRKLTGNPAHGGEQVYEMYRGG